MTRSWAPPWPRWRPRPDDKPDIPTEGSRIACFACGARPFPELGPPGTRQDFDLIKRRGRTLAVFARAAGRPAHEPNFAPSGLRGRADDERRGIEELRADIREHGLREPLVIWADNSLQKETGQHWGLSYCPRYLIDGRARAKALGFGLGDLNGLDGLPAKHLRIVAAWTRKPKAVKGVRSWRYLDPLVCVVSLNVRRRHLSQEQRRQIVEGMLRRRPELTDRAHASAACVDHKTVTVRRFEAEACGDIPHIPPTERVGADGRRSRARKTPVESPDHEAVIPPDWDAVIPPDRRPINGVRFVSPVKPNAPKRDRVVAARGYVAWLGLTVEDLNEDA